MRLTQIHIGRASMGEMYMGRNRKSFQNVLNMHVCSILTIRLVVKEMQSTKLYGIILISAALIGILILSPAISSLIDENVWQRGSFGIIAHVAKSGSIEDIQAAVDKAKVAGGGVVLIPEGTFLFDAYGDTQIVNIDVPAGGLTIFGAGRDRTFLQMPVDDEAPNSLMFLVRGLSGGLFRMSGITFKGRSNRDTSPTGDTAIVMQSCKDFRIDHCSFYDMGSQCIRVSDDDTQYGIDWGDPDRVSQGVIDHNDFIDIYKPEATRQGRGWGYGIAIGRAGHYWWTYWEPDFWELFGNYKRNVFIEDNYFTGTRHAVACSSGGVYVFRHNIVENQAHAECATTGHPVRVNIHGMGACEIYNNIFRYTGEWGEKFRGPLVEGGSALIFNNTFENLIWAVGLGSCEYNDNPFYPQGCTKDVYIWNNAGDTSNIATWSNEGMGGCPAPIEGEQYFLHAPPPEKNYTSYPYPHPLTLIETPHT